MTLQLPKINRNSRVPLHNRNHFRSQRDHSTYNFPHKKRPSQLQAKPKYSLSSRFHEEIKESTYTERINLRDLLEKDEKSIKNTFYRKKRYEYLKKQKKSVIREGNLKDSQASISSKPKKSQKRKKYKMHFKRFSIPGPSALGKYAQEFLGEKYSKQPNK